MSFGIFEAAVTSEQEAGLQRQASADKLAGAIYDVRQELGPFLFQARSLEEFRDRVAMVKNDQSLYKLIEAHLTPVTGVVRRIAGKNGQLEKEFKAILATGLNRTADWGDDVLSGGNPDSDWVSKTSPAAQEEIGRDTDEFSKLQGGGLGSTPFGKGGSRAQAGLDGAKDLKPKGNWKGYLDSVKSPDAAKVKSKNFTGKGEDNFTGTAEPNFIKGSHELTAYADWCEAHGRHPRRKSSLQAFATNRQQFNRIARMIVAGEHDIPQDGKAHPNMISPYTGDIPRSHADSMREHTDPHGYTAEPYWHNPADSARDMMINPPEQAPHAPQHEAYRHAADHRAPKPFVSDDDMNQWMDNSHAVSELDTRGRDQGYKGEPPMMKREPGAAESPYGAHNVDHTGLTPNLRAYDELTGPGGPNGGIKAHLANYKAWCNANGYRYISARNIEVYAKGNPRLAYNLALHAQAAIRTARRRQAGQHSLPGSEKADKNWQQQWDDAGIDSQGYSEADNHNYGNDHPDKHGTPFEPQGVLDLNKQGLPKLRREHWGPGDDMTVLRRKKGGRRTAAPDYLQKADDALTQLLNQKAQEFQETIAPLQQALVTVQQATQLAQQANPLNVMPPPGSVQVMPGQQAPGDIGMQDPSGGTDPQAAAAAALAPAQAAGQLPPPPGGDPSQGGAPPGGQGAPPPAAGDPTQQMQARRKRRAAMPPDYDTGNGQHRPDEDSPYQDENRHDDYYADTGDMFYGPGKSGPKWSKDFVDPHAHIPTTYSDTPEHQASRSRRPFVDAHRREVAQNLRQAAGVLDLWNKYQNQQQQHGQLGLGGDYDYEQFKNQYGVGDQAINKLKMHHQTGITAKRLLRLANRIHRAGISLDNSVEPSKTNHIEDAVKAQHAKQDKHMGQLGYKFDKSLNQWTKPGQVSVKNHWQHTAGEHDYREGDEDQIFYPQRGHEGWGHESGPSGPPYVRPQGDNMRDTPEHHWHGEHEASLKQAWSGWGPAQFPRTRKVAGWDWDEHLNGYASKSPREFTCACGDVFPTPGGFHRCACGKSWNSYVIGTGGSNREASTEKFLVREIPTRPDVIVAANQRLAGEHEKDPRGEHAAPIHGVDGWMDEAIGLNTDRGGGGRTWHSIPALETVDDPVHGQYPRMQKVKQPAVMGRGFGPGKHRANRREASAYVGWCRANGLDPRVGHHLATFRAAWGKSKPEPGWSATEPPEGMAEHWQDTPAPPGYDEQYGSHGKHEAIATLVDPRTGKIHNLVDPGELGEGEDAGHPKPKKTTKDWHHRDKNQRWTGK